MIDLEQIKRMAQLAPGRNLTLEEYQFIQDNRQVIAELQAQQRVIRDQAEAVADACRTLTTNIPADLIIEDGVAYCFVSHETSGSLSCFTAERDVQIYLNTHDKKSWCVSVYALRPGKMFKSERWLGSFKTREEAEAQGHRWIKTATCSNCKGQVVSIDDLN